MNSMMQRTTRLVSSCRLQLQVFAACHSHSHTARHSVFHFPSLKTHGGEANVLHNGRVFKQNLSALSQRRSESDICKLQRALCRNLKQSSSLLCQMNQVNCICVGPRRFKDSRQMLNRPVHHHFSTIASYSVLNVCRKRRYNQSAVTSAFTCCRVQRYGSSAVGNETGDPLSPKSPQFRCYMDHLRNEHQAISERLQGGEPLSDSKQKELRGSMMELGEILEKWTELISMEEENNEIQHLIQDGHDKEMQDLALSEKDQLQDRIEDVSQELVDLLMSSEETDDNDVIMEFSAGVGGQEAMLFASDMFDMYQRYAYYRRWSFTILEYFTSDIGGLRHATVSITGDQAYRLLRQEAGVHRVQRVPKTERQGRIHTSTMSIAVLPQPKEIDLKLDPKDLRIETKKASGAGGQHVNTTDSAVRITHVPTGISAESQQERSQHKNRSIAMTMLQTRIYNRILEDQTNSERSMRRSQVGTRGRSEKIRTYNYQQDRITDHRISRSIHGVMEYLLGSEHLDEMMVSCMEGEECQNIQERILEVYDMSKENSR
ncbi:peptide chain release factor 1-like, mitochondrial isoform X2 [Lytechinus pictus]